MNTSTSKSTDSLTQKLRSLEQMWIILPFLLFAILLIFSNFHDWDYYRAPVEAERRSWLLDGALPLWSYQICGGLTRIGDPDSFGLSPSFIFVLLFGSLWGTKLMMLLHCLIGFLFSRRLFIELPTWLKLDGHHQNDDATLGTALALAFTFGNYFIWHLHVGHLNFSATYLALALIYFTSKSLLQGLNTKEFGLATLMTWWFFSGGFYPGTVYLLIPLYLFLCLPIGIKLLSLSKHRASLRTFLSKTIQCASFHLLGMACAFYKIAGVWNQQEAHPRTPVEPPVEIVSFGRTLLAQFTPTIHENFLGLFKGNADFQVHEYSAFSAISVLLLGVYGLLIFLRAKKRPLPAIPKELKALFFWSLLLIGTALLFSFGETAWSPHQWLQKSLYQNSVRAVGRYQIFLHFALTLFGLLCVYFIQTIRTFILRYGLAFISIIISINFLTFTSKLSYNELQEQRHLEQNLSKKMRNINVTSEIKRVPSVLKGHALLNCYSGLTHPMRFMKDGLWYSPEQEDYYEHTMPLLFHPTQKLSDACVNESYFEQNRIILASACPKDSCIQLNDLSPADRQTFTYNEEHKRFCLRPTP